MSSDEESVHSIVEEVENELELHPEDDNVEVVGEQPTEEANGSQNAEDEAEEDKARKVVKPKRVVKNPQPKLNEQTLRGPRGLSAIEGYFQRVKFKGKGHEEHDLNVLMKTYEYWCHRLFPKFPYDHCIARLETLGTKRGTQTLLKLIRMDMATEREIVSDNEEKDDLQESTEPTEDAFDQLLPSTSGAQAHSTSETQELPEDIQERIRQNKERAERIRLERLQRARDQAAISLPGSSRLTDSQNSQNEQANQDSFKNQTEKEKEEGTIEDLLDEINSQEISNEKLRKKTSSVIYSDDEIGGTGQNEVIQENKSPSTSNRISAKNSVLESSEDENSQPENSKKRSVEGLLNGFDDQEVKTKKKKVKVMDSDNDSELDTNSQEEQTETIESDEDENSAVKKQSRQGILERKAKKRGKVIDSDDEKQPESTIDQLLDDINTTESPNKENTKNIESDEDLHIENKRQYRKKLKIIESDEEESQLFPNDKSDSKERETEDGRPTKKNQLIASDSEESDDENNINQDNVDKRLQDKDKFLQIGNSVFEITDSLQETKVNSQSMALDEDSKNGSNKEDPDILNEINS